MKKILPLLILFLFSSSAWALRPIVQYHDLIAGQPAAGYRDGTFNTAQFNDPQGLCFDPEGSRLFVADKENNCIRVIYRNENNRVETLAGSKEAGHVNGTLKSARFDKPCRLTWAGKDLLVVYDSGNNRLRAIDLTQNVVKDLAGTGKSGDLDGKDSEATLGSIWDIQFVPAENTVYFSEPASAKLRRLDLEQGTVSTVPLSEKQLCPGALCFFRDQLCVASWGNGHCYLLDPKTHNLTSIGNLNESETSSYRVMAIAPSGDDLYAFEQAAIPRWIKLSTHIGIKVLNFFGREMDSQMYPRTFTAHIPRSFIADPKELGKFYLTSETLPFVMSLKDYNFAKGEDIGTYNLSDMTDFDYPAQKPPHTYRILVCGNSLSYSLSFEDEREHNWNRSNTFPKQLELMLNTTAAFDDVPLNYEVLSIGHPEAFDPAFLWPYYKVPDLVKKFDIDLVLYVVPTLNDPPYFIYYQNPITTEGIPTMEKDTEYLLKPYDQKIPPGAAKDFYERCKKKGWVRTASTSQLSFDPLGKILSDPGTRKDAVEMLGKPIQLFAQKLEGLKTTAGDPVRYQMLVIYRDEANEYLQPIRDFWKEIAAKAAFPYMDIADDFLAFKPTYEGFYSYEDFHYKVRGTNLYCYLVAQELIRHQILPYPKAEK